MNYDAKRAFEFLNKIGFVRTAGSEEELRAAQMIQAECAAIGVDAIIEEFKILDGEVEVAELEVTAPYNQKYTCTGYKRCADADIEAELVYVENGLDAALVDVKDKIVLLNTPPRLPVFRKLLDAGVAGFIAMTGTMRDTEDDSDLPTGMLRKTLPDLPLHASTQMSVFTSGGACEMAADGCERVVIARALALHPEVLCFDEPTSALDPELTAEVLRVIRGLKDKNNTMIVVTHEMEFAKSVADVVIYMADGVIEEMGTPAEVFDHPKSEKTLAFLRGTQELLF